MGWYRMERVASATNRFTRRCKSRFSDRTQIQQETHAIQHIETFSQMYTRFAEAAFARQEE